MPDVHVLGPCVGQAKTYKPIRPDTHRGGPQEAPPGALGSPVD